MERNSSLLFYVQHLLGIGHVRRARLIGAALERAGIAVTVAAGGFPVSGEEFGGATVVQLPPVRAADASFKTLIDGAGRVIDDHWRANRRDQLLALFAQVRPDLVLIESFPFGRRAFRFELLPLLEAAATAQPRPLIACSVRDILVGKADPARYQEMAAIARRWFDLVLVHGDPALIDFAASFPPAAEIADLIRYTGYVAAPDDRNAAPDAGDGSDEVIVSVGGGAVGLPLLWAALAARPLSILADRRWRLLVGPEIAATAVEALSGAAPPGVTVEPARADFPHLLQRCRLSISQAGYNTVLDLLRAGCPAVVVPFAAGAETEQATRARLLAERGLLVMVDEAGLTPTALASAIERALARARPVDPPALAFDGAIATARLLTATPTRKKS